MTHSSRLHARGFELLQGVIRGCRVASAANTLSVNGMIGYRGLKLSIQLTVDVENSAGCRKGGCLECTGQVAQ